MEKSKIETKKITERYKLDMPKKETGKFKLKLTVSGQASKEQNVVGISPETYQDLLKIYPKNADTSKSKNQLPYENMKTHEVCEVKTSLLENENKCDFDYSSFQLNRPISSNQTKSPTSSVSSLSSVVSLETESSVQTPNSDESDESLKEEIDVNLKGLHAESQRKVTDSSCRICYNQSICERRASKRHTANDKMAVQDSIAVKRTGIGSRHFDEEDVEIDSTENPIQMQDRRSPSLTEEEDPIRELRDALENSANCLLKCLKSLQNASPRQEKLCLTGDTSMKFDCSTPECKCSEMNFKNLIAKRDDNNSPASLPILHTLKNKSDTDTKRRKSAVTCHSYNPQSIHPDFSRSEYYSCNCCSRKCLRFQSSRRHLNTGVLEVNTKSKKKMAISLSQGDFASDVPMKTSRSSCENKNRCFLPPYDLPISETDSVENETGVGDSSKLIHRSNAGENEQAFESCSAPIGKPNLIKNKKYRLKKKSMTEEMYRDSDQCEKDAEDNDTEDNVCIAVTMILFLVFPVVIIFGFILFIFFFVG